LQPPVRLLTRLPPYEAVAKRLYVLTWSECGATRTVPGLAWSTLGSTLIDPDEMTVSKW